MAISRMCSLPRAPLYFAPAVDPIPLLQVLRRARRALALNFPQPLWVRAEISQVSERRGHRYLSLVQQDPDGRQAVAKVSAALWARTYASVVRQRGRAAADVLAGGQEVSLRVEVDLHEVYGLKLVVVDWDPAFTLGQLALKRQAIIEQLRASGELRRNGERDLPSVVQRVAVLTSASAAGYADFEAQLDGNPYGYRFERTLFDVAVQGPRLVGSVTMALGAAGADAGAYDAVVLLRGGGSKLDLASFDELEVGRAIAACGLPVLVGIGHEVDETLPDLVAHTSVKTPTALAEFLIARAAEFEARQLALGAQVARWASATTQGERVRLANRGRDLHGALARQVLRKREGVGRFAQALKDAARSQLATRRLTLDATGKQIDALDPRSVLARGFALVCREGSLVGSAADVRPGDRLTTRFHDGSIESTVVA